VHFDKICDGQDSHHTISVIIVVSCIFMCHLLATYVQIVVKPIKWCAATRNFKAFSEEKNVKHAF
jgi:hypothetical protein